MDSIKKQNIWNVIVSFVPFKTSDVGNTSYALWFKSFLRPKYNGDYVGIETTLKEEVKNGKKEKKRGFPSEESKADANPDGCQF